MWRAVLRSMYSSGLNPLTSPAILQSKIVGSKCVIRPMPETPSIMFDQTVSTSLPIGVMKPMPVTATRRPFELDVIGQAYGRQGQTASAHVGKTAGLPWTSCPKLHQSPRFRAAFGAPGRNGAADGLPARRDRRRAAPAACQGGRGPGGGAGRGRPRPP